MRILSFLAALLLLGGCNDSKKTTGNTVTSEQTVETSSADKVPGETAPSEAAAAEPAPVEKTPAEAPAADTAPAETATAAPVATVPVAEKSAPVTVSTSNVTTVTQTVSETSPAILFQKCAACHGNHAEKSALNQSAVIGEWDSKRIAAAIEGYQQGTYGGAMKVLMQSQVKGLTAAEIHSLSEYIANLNVKTH